MVGNVEDFYSRDDFVIIITVICNCNPEHTLPFQTKQKKIHRLPPQWSLISDSYQVNIIQMQLLYREAIMLVI